MNCCFHADSALLDGATELERDFSLMRGLEIGQLRVGVGAYPAQMSVGKAIGSLLSRHPQLRIEVMTDDLRAIIDAVLAGKLDLAVIELSLAAGEPRLATEPLPAHPAHFYCRAGHPLLAEKDPTIEQILKFPLAGTRMPPRVAKDFLDLAKAGAIDPDTGDYLPPVKVDSIGMVKDVVLASDAVAVAPIAFIAEDVAQRTLVPLRRACRLDADGLRFRLAPRHHGLARSSSVQGRSAARGRRSRRRGAASDQRWGGVTGALDRAGRDRHVVGARSAPALWKPGSDVGRLELAGRRH